MTIRATTSAATTPAMIATLPPDGDVGSDGRSVDDGVGLCVVDGGGVGFGRAVDFGCMPAVDAGCT